MHDGPRPTDPASPARPLVAYYHYDAVCETWTWSDEMYLIHGYEPGEVALTTDLLLALRHPDDRTRVAEEIKAAPRRR